jgi:hypothetical protein
VVIYRPGKRGADGMRLYPKLREGIYTSSSSRYVKKGNIKEEAFTDVNILSRELSVAVLLL